jgi:hypothetical protein
MPGDARTECFVSVELIKGGGNRACVKWVYLVFLTSLP